MALAETTCCGVHEIESLSNPESTLADVCEDKYPDDMDYSDPKDGAFIVFTDVVEYRNGDKLAKYIKENRLGVVYETRRAKMNPNTNNLIKVWVWSPNERNLKRWYKEWKTGV